MTSSRLAPADPGEASREGSAAAARAPERVTDGIARVREMMANVRGDAKHAAAAESTADALWVLYDRVLRLSPDAADERDRFYLSKGHGPMAYYAILAIKGLIDPAELYQFGAFHSMLGQEGPGRSIAGGPGRCRQAVGWTLSAGWEQPKHGPAWKRT